MNGEGLRSKFILSLGNLERLLKVKPETTAAMKIFSRLVARDMINFISAARILAAFQGASTVLYSLRYRSSEQRRKTAKGPQPKDGGGGPVFPPGLKRRWPGAYVARRLQPQEGDAPSSRLGGGPSPLQQIRRLSCYGLLFLCMCGFLPGILSAQETPPAPAGVPTTESQVVILGYHRFENPAKDSLAITPAAFRAQMQELKDAGLTVISMEDFLAWRRGEKNIPERAVVLTIDDGYNCTYHEAWPILREFGYPFTIFVYGKYISAGGRSITWEQLEEMRDGGVDIGSHSISHDNMVRPKRAGGQDYETWLNHELKGSKDLLEGKLGIPIKTFAYPYGVNNARVQEVGLGVGYEALFTVVGKKVGKDAPAAAIGRYVIQSDKPEIFRMATRFGAAQGVVAGAAGAAGPGMAVSPAHGAVLAEAPAEIQANLGSLGKVDPKSVTLRVSGLGQVSPVFDPATGMLTYRPGDRLHHREIQVIASARVDGKKVDAVWSFRIEPGTQMAAPPSEEALTPPEA